MLMDKCVSKMSFNSNIVVLQSCLDPQITFYRPTKTFLFGKDPHNNHTITILISEYMDLKIIISSYTAIHIAIAISVQIIVIRYFFKNVQT